MVLGICSVRSPGLDCVVTALLTLLVRTGEIHLQSKHTCTLQRWKPVGLPSKLLSYSSPLNSPLSCFQHPPQASISLLTPVSHYLLASTLWILRLTQPTRWLTTFNWCTNILWYFVHPPCQPPYDDSHTDTRRDCPL